MTVGNVTTELDGHVFLMGLDRAAKRNAFDLIMFEKLAYAYAELERNDDLRVGVLFAHGDHFTGGLELPQWVGGFTDGRFPNTPPDALDPLGLDPDNRTRKPIIMAVQGYCYTIGIELLLATDFRIAARDVHFAQIEIQRGIYPVGGATVRLHEEIGWGNAMRYLLTGDPIDADEAYRLGLVQELVQPGQQLDRARELAYTVAAQAPLGVYATLKSARLARQKGNLAAIAQLLPDLQPLMHSQDVQEGVASFVERRPAKFTGK